MLILHVAISSLVRNTGSVKLMN